MLALRRSVKSLAKLAFASSFLALSWASSSPAGGMHGGGGHSMHGGEAMVGSHMGYSNFLGYSHSIGSYNRSNTIYYNPSIFYGYGIGGPYVYSPSLAVVTPGFAPFLGPAFPQGVAPFGMGGGFGGGLNLPMPPPRVWLTRHQATTLALLGNPIPARSKEQTEIGDRSFRAHNIKRAEDKYKLAVKADPTSPTPHVHLAQVAVARGNYAAAADHLRDAVTVATDGTWLMNAPDIQAIFGEPGDFAKQLAKLETHLQANPGDRDAWFVLGAETYLSGRTRQAFDVFQRLTDRRTDEALTAFIDASKPRPVAAN